MSTAREALAEEVKRLARAYGSARADEAVEDVPMFMADKKRAVQESFAALFTAIDRLVAAAPAAPVQEPVAIVESWTNSSYGRNYKLKWLRDVPEDTKLYTHPSAPAQQEKP